MVGSNTDAAGNLDSDGFHSYTDFNVWTARKRIEKLRYMHRNPVARGLVQEPGQWPWSSYRSYAFGEKGAVRINQWGEIKLTGSMSPHLYKERKGGPSTRRPGTAMRMWATTR